MESKIIGIVIDGEIPNNLLPEIIEEILKRLPVKSLLKFRCVSKSWFSLISSPEFIKTHLNFSTNNPSFTNHRIMYVTSLSCDPYFPLRHCSIHSLFIEHETVASLSDYPMRDPDRAVSVVGSCNGVICIAIDEKDMCLWNPSSRRWKKLPPLPAVEMEDEDIHYATGFGFGYNECDDDYKVVTILGVHREISGARELVINIYSLKADSWNTIQDYKSGSLIYFWGKYASGKIHFATTQEMIIGDIWDIVSIDLRTGAYGMVEQPDYGVPPGFPMLGVRGGCICVLTDYQKIRGDVWVLKEYNVKESWTKVLSIPYTNHPDVARLCLSDMLMLPAGEVLLVLGVNLVVYNPKDGTFRHPPPTTNVDYFDEAHMFIESLVLL